ncbi:TRAP-type mannitol/chloroaromatic compound transport system, small permease component [Paracoccus isoporae]|uniref:TRAP transporter small permease protein n=1 Tax=Paracoccus isoporae TaxID=591205 RepID=A0A1G6U6G8_9RHOB|nr:TRAP transporter small permease subunit [Paracoccus isoporae]SDD36871.1 TRAP-type mannitol/chloroaromatic compound transport system, small permease component [Paracoccus isoporae]
MLRLADGLDAINRITGQTVRWLALLLLAVQFAIVLLRYVFGIGAIWADEAVLYTHASLFMLASGYTLLIDRHVRVDIFYASWPPRGKALLDLAGHCLLLLPSLAVIAWWSWPAIRASWAIREGAISVGGLPFSYLLKSLIPAFCALMAVQGIALILRDLARLTGHGEGETPHA